MLIPWLATALAGPALESIGTSEGLLQVRQPNGTVLQALPAVVVSVHVGHQPPDFGDAARSLGRSGRSWRVPVRPGEDALQAANRWTLHPAVQAAYPDVLLPTERQAFNDPSYGAQWYLELLEYETMMDLGRGSPEVRIAVIDSGIDIDHPDLVDAVTEPYDAFDSDDDPSPVGDDLHGTAVSGIVLARADNNSGIAGLCPTCTLIPVRLIGEGPNSNLSRHVEAFEHAIAADAWVINNSWSFREPTEVPGPLASVIERARTEPRGGRGALVVFAAGNDDRELGDTELNGLPSVLTVGAYDRYGNQTNYTNRGAIDLSAPSATVSLAPNNGITETFGGTSAAAPVVSGIAGWLLAFDPSLTAAELHELLIDHATPVNAAGTRDPFLGWGRIDALALHAAVVPEPEGCGCNARTSNGPFWASLASWVRRR
jgi:subtilisin family serine protease